MRPLDVDEIAARIRACRAYAGLTRKGLAEKMSTSPSTVERWEKAHPGSLGGEDSTRARMILWEVAKTCDLDPAWAVSDWDVPPSYRVKESDIREIATRLRRVEQAVGVEGVLNDADLGISIAEFMEMIGDSPLSWGGGTDSPAVRNFGRLLDALGDDPERLAQFRRFFGVRSATEPPAGERPEDVADEIERQANGPASRKAPASESRGAGGSRGRGRSR
jgi:transcriptional regulator with XRE-family HTH domain